MVRMGPTRSGLIEGAFIVAAGVTIVALALALALVLALKARNA